MDRVLSFIKRNIMLVFCVVLFAICVIIDPNFLSVFNLFGLTTDITIIGLLALGQALVIMLGCIDLSVAMVANMTTVVISWSMKHMADSVSPAVNTLLSFALAFAFSFVLGAISGLSVTKLKLHPIVATLGTQWIAKGISLFLLSGVATGFAADGFTVIGKRLPFGPFSISFFVFVALAILTYFFLTKTGPGRSIYAIGGNEYAAYVTGIKTDKYKISTYLISAMLATLAGIVVSAYTRTGYAKAAEGYEMWAIAAVVMASVPLTGGKGNILNVVLGVAILRMVSKLIIFTPISGYLEYTFVGFIILILLIIRETQHTLTQKRRLNAAGPKALK